MGLSSIFSFLDLSPWAWETKAKINKLDYSKLKSLCTVKKAINKMKRLPTEWEKVFANDITNRSLIPKVYKELLQLNSKKMQTIQFKKWAEDLNRHFFSKKTYQWLANT